MWVLFIVGLLIIGVIVLLMLLRKKRKALENILVKSVVAVQKPLTDAKTESEDKKQAVKEDKKEKAFRASVDHDDELDFDISEYIQTEEKSVSKDNTIEPSDKKADKKHKADNKSLNKQEEKADKEEIKTETAQELKDSSIQADKKDTRNDIPKVQNEQDAEDMVNTADIEEDDKIDDNLISDGCSLEPSTYIVPDKNYDIEKNNEEKELLKSQLDAELESLDEIDDELDDGIDIEINKDKYIQEDSLSDNELDDGFDDHLDIDIDAKSRKKEEIDSDELDYDDGLDVMEDNVDSQYDISEQQIRRIFGLGSAPEIEKVEQEKESINIENIEKDNKIDLKEKQEIIDGSISAMQAQLENYNKSLKEAEEKAQLILEQVAMQEEATKKLAEEKIIAARREAEERMEAVKKEIAEREEAQKRMLEAEAGARRKALEEEAERRKKQQELEAKRIVLEAQIDAEEKLAAESRKQALERAEAMRLAAEITSAEKAAKKAEEDKQLAFLDSLLYNANSLDNIGFFIIDNKGEKKFFYTLFTENRKPLYESITYASVASCKSAINSFRKNVVIGEFSVSGQEGAYTFLLRNGSAMYYGFPQKTKAECEKQIQLVKQYAETASVVVK